MSIEIREATHDDVPRLIEAYQWLFEEPYGTPATWEVERSSRAMREAIEGPESTILVALDGDELVGFSATYIDLHSIRFGPRCWIEDLAVDPARRSQGIGKALIEAASDWAKPRGASHLELDSALGRTEAHRFYDREGAERSYSFHWDLSS